MITFRGETRYVNLNLNIDLGNTINIKSATIDSFGSNSGSPTVIDIQGQDAFTIAGKLNGSSIISAGTETLITNFAPGKLGTFELSTSGSDLTATKRPNSGKTDELVYTSSGFILSSTFAFVVTWNRGAGTIKFYRGTTGTLIATSTAGVGGIYDQGTAWTVSPFFTIDAVYNRELSASQVATLAAVL